MSQSPVQVEVACRGPFRFDVVQQLATFQDRVDVLQVHPNGPSDQLQCELLSIYFARPRGAAAANPEATAGQGRPEGGAPLDLQPRRVEARGNPVLIAAPSQDFQARGELVQYDLWSQQIRLSGSQEVSLQHGPNEIHARSVQYQPAPDGRLGQAAAQGPGRLRAQMAGRPDQLLEVRWNDQLRLRPHEQQQVISLTGGAELGFAGMGQLAAREIHFWLLEVSAPNGKTMIRPDRMLARQEVRLNSPQLSGSVEELQVWFEPGDEPPPKPTGLAAGLSNLQSMGRAAELAQQFPASARIVQGAMGGSDGWGPAGGEMATSAGGAAPAGTASSPADPAQRFEIVGRLLRARIALLGTQPELAELLVEGNVRFAETRSAKPEEQPLVINGDQIHVVDGGKPSALLTVLGQPAHVEAPGLGLTGSNINLNRGANLLWIEGQGRMTLPVDRDMEGRPLAHPGFLDVRWQDRMAFDGRTARFEESVVAAAQHQQLETRTLEVVFRQPIRFADARPQTKPEPERIQCRGGVTMESHSFDERGQTSIERVKVRDLAINLISGAFTAAGLGSMSSVRRGSPGNMLELGRSNPLAGEPAASGPRALTGAAGALTGEPGALAPGRALGNAPIGRSAHRPAVADPSAAQQPDEDKLVYLNIRFLHSVTGNLKSRETAFRERVRTVYGPVQSWQETLDADRPETLGPEAVLLTCEQLAVAELPTPIGNRRAIGLEAADNVVVEGRSFTARGARMTYDEAKGLVILEGDGRSDAELFRQEVPGGPRAQIPARKIYYWHRLNQWRVDGPRSLDMGPLPASPRGKPERK